MFYVKWHDTSYKVYSVEFYEKDGGTYFLTYGFNYDKLKYEWFWLEASNCKPA